MVSKVELRNHMDKIGAVKHIIQTVRSEALKGKENEAGEVVEGGPSANEPAGLAADSAA
jgi:hypothetical protein